VPVAVVGPVKTYWLLFPLAEAGLAVLAVVAAVVAAGKQIVRKERS
jgi:hypothetical protein